MQVGNMKKKDFIKKLNSKKKKLALKLLEKASTKEKVFLWNDFCKVNYCTKYMIYEYNIDFINDITFTKNNEEDFVFDYKYATIIGFDEGYKTFDRLDDLDSPFDFRVLYKWLTDDYIYYYKS